VVGEIVYQRRNSIAFEKGGYGEAVDQAKKCHSIELTFEDMNHHTRSAQ
jgi:hypothetical protein